VFFPPFAEKYNNFALWQQIFLLFCSSHCKTTTVLHLLTDCPSHTKVLQYLSPSLTLPYTYNILDYPYWKQTIILHLPLYYSYSFFQVLHYFYRHWSNILLFFNVYTLQNLQFLCLLTHYINLSLLPFFYKQSKCWNSYDYFSTNLPTKSSSYISIFLPPSAFFLCFSLPLALLTMTSQWCYNSVVGGNRFQIYAMALLTRPTFTRAYILCTYYYYWYSQPLWRHTVMTSHTASDQQRVPLNGNK